jgi:Ca2+-binding RTX toxin-like protein
MGSLLFALAAGALLVATSATAHRHAPAHASFIGPYTGVAVGEQMRVGHKDNHASGDSHITSDSDEDYQGRFIYSFRVENGEVEGTGDGVYLKATWHLSGVNGKYGGFSCDPAVTGTPFRVSVSGFKLDNDLLVAFTLGGSEQNADYDCGAHFTGFSTTSRYLWESMLQTAEAQGAAEYFRINVAHPRLGHFTSHTTDENDTTSHVIDNTWDISITPPSTTKDDSGGGPAPSTAKRKGSGTDMCTIKGTPGNNVLRGTSKADVICGFGGNDVMYGAGGDDVIIGGPGNDKIDGGSGFDLLYGDAGNDSFTAKDGTRDTVVGGGGKDRGIVDKGKDVATGVEKLS